MTDPTVLYPLAGLWLQALGVTPHATACAALADLVTALLQAQSLRPSALFRALLRRRPLPARQGYQRVARAWERPWLAPAWLMPRLVRAVWALFAPDPAVGPTYLALDSVRCGRWESFTVGVVWHGRAVPVGWAVLPFPWPKGQFTPTVCALRRQVAAALPSGARVHLVADRAFPSRPLFQTLRGLGWAWTVRLQANHVVTVGDTTQRVRALLPAGRLGQWRSLVGTFGPVPGQLVLGRGLVVLPAHQRTAGSLRHRAAQAARRRRHITTKHRGQRDASAATDAWVVLFSSAAHWAAATTAYRARWATEGTYRDAQGGWDGRHGWDLERRLQRVTDRAVVERVLGLWALGTVMQMWVGSAFRRAPAAVRLIGREWTTTGRLSVWACGQFALTEPTGRLMAWLRESLERGARRVAATGPVTATPPAPTDTAPLSCAA